MKRKLLLFYILVYSFSLFLIHMYVVYVLLFKNENQQCIFF